MRYVSPVLAILLAFPYLTSGLGGLNGGPAGLVAVTLVLGVVLLTAAVLVISGYTPLLLAAGWAAVICFWAWGFFGILSIVGKFPGENIQQLLVLPALNGVYDLIGLGTALIAWRMAGRRSDAEALP
jgi:hypothetical protein